MHFTSAASAALLSSLAMAKPLTDAKSNLKFSVNQVLDTNAKPLTPQQQMARTYLKYGKTLPPKIKTAQKFQSGSVVATPQSYDLAYLSPVTVGGQTFNLNFDTGSADLWVFSTQQPAGQTDGRPMYDPSKSKNATLMQGQQWSITYGDGSGASGDVFADTVVIGGVTATSQAVEAATSVSQQFLSDTQSGGLVGLAFSNLNTVRPNQQLTFFDSVRSSLAKAVFTANLKKGAPGSYDFGYVDPKKYSGAITWTPVQSSTGFWQFAMGAYQIGNKARSSQAMGNGIADTGTTLLYLPDATVTAYWNSVTGASYNSQFGAYIFPCAANLPTFTIFIQGVPFVIPGNYMNYAPISNTMCFGGLQSNTGIGFSILGDVFLKSVFAVFDQSTGVARLGFAKQSGTSTSNQAAAKTPTTTPAAVTTTTTTTIRKPTTTRRTTTTRKTTAARKVSKLVCNARYVAAIKKAYPRKPKQFCRNYKPAAGDKRSIVKGIPNAAALKRVCACMVQR